MKIGASTILYRDRPLDRDLFREFQEAGISSQDTWTEPVSFGSERKRATRYS